MITFIVGWRAWQARSMVVIGLALALSAASGWASTQEKLTSRAVSSRANQWLLPYLKAGDFSGVVLIAQGDQALFERAYGKADFAKRIPNHLGTRFRIASLSKTFTAAAIELLIKKEQVKLADTLDRYVEGVPNGDKITVAHLLLHRSGVGRAPQLEQECLSEEERLSQLKKSTPDFAPGTESRYSNEGYFLLALIVEKVSQMPYADFLRQKIFSRLGMKNTGSACKELPPGDNAQGSLPGGAGRDPLLITVNQAVPVGPGSIFSTARDLHLWLRAVDMNPAFQVNQLEYPYGWGKRNFSGRNLIEQSGIVEGFNAHMALYPAEHIYAVVLSNVQSGFFNRIEKDLESVLFGGELSRPPEIAEVKVSANKLTEYAGTYRSAKIPVDQILSLQGNEIRIRWSDTPFSRPLVSRGKDSFFYRVEYAEVEFQRDEKGFVAKSVWRWPQGDPLTFDKVQLTFPQKRNVIPTPAP